MSFKKYKKTELIELVKELYTEIENCYNIIEEKDETINKLLDDTKSESSIENEEIKPLSKREQRLKNYLEKKIKVILVDEEKEIYKNYYEKLFC